jgi:hypothetical protein
MLTLQKPEQRTNKTPEPNLPKYLLKNDFADQSLCQKKRA